ncbi:MAG TPA: right-handed parallel beta-helix repeat-containing protein [Phycisphaerae bacterium]|nr:right-handed parallel beta-helix repeat-containing protein [Phycisphaerae bacterium]HNU46591.1 right-handed parallel beta-helix repeat-containing protein [Phycisphaerae bacterium]
MASVKAIADVVTSVFVALLAVPALAQTGQAGIRGVEASGALTVDDCLAGPDAAVAAPGLVRAAVSNDNCAQAEAIAGFGFFAFDTTEATTDGPAHAACAFDVDPQTPLDVWYCWTSDTDGPVAVETCRQTTVDTKLVVYQGCTCPPSDANLLACADDDCVYQSRVEFAATTGRSYLIRIGVHPGLGGGQGTFNITSADQPELPCAQPPENCQPPDGWNAYASDRAQYLVADDFRPATDGSISALCWWGTYYGESGNCLPGGSDTFEVRYFADDGGLPGTLLAGPFRQAEGTLLVQGPVSTGGLVMDRLFEYEYSAQHAPVPVTAGQCCWVEISNPGFESCVWLWEAAPRGASGESQALGNRRAAKAGPGAGPPEYDAATAGVDDLAWCLNVTPGDARWCLTSPINDNFADRLPITEGAVAFDTRGASTDGPALCICKSLGDPLIARDIWFEYVPAATGTATLLLCDVLYDVWAVVDTAVCVDDAPCQAVDDWPLSAAFAFPVQAGVPNIIRIGGYGGATGPGTLVLSLNDPDCDGDGSPDVVELVTGASWDDDGNGVPDECEVTRLYVDADATGLNHGTSWADAFTELEWALELVASGYPHVTEIWVAEGTYHSLGPAGSGFRLQDAVAWYGGFAGGETELAERSPADHPTILTGDVAGDDPTSPTNCYEMHVSPGCDDPACAAEVCRGQPSCCTVSWDADCADIAAYECGGLLMPMAENGAHVVIAQNCEASTILDGFVLTRGYATSSSPLYYSGAGMYIMNASPVVRNCVFTRNVADPSGYSTYGGAVYVGGTSSPQFINCVFAHNLAAVGGAVFNRSSSDTVWRNCVFSGNLAAIFGGGVVEASPESRRMILTNCTIATNWAQQGPTAGVAGTGNLLMNCIVWGNTDSSGQGETAQISGGQVNYSCVQGWTGDLGGVGNFGDDPLFVDTLGPDGVAGTPDDDVHLLPLSPCIDAGDPTYDFSLEPEPDGGRINIGAYGNTPEAATRGWLYIEDYVVISERRVGRTTFQYEMAVVVCNHSDQDAPNVILELLAVPENVTIISGAEVTVGPVAAGVTVTSLTNFVIQVDRTTPVTPLGFSWRVVQMGD